MRKSRFNEEQIIGILKESEVSEAKRLRALEEENRQLKHAVAELLLDKRALQAVMSKKW